MSMTIINTKVMLCYYTVCLILRGVSMECPLSTVTIDDANELKEILTSCKRIAIAGLSPDPTKDSHKVAKFLQAHGYKIYPIYPKEEMILGEKVYRSLSEITEPVDMVDMFRKPEVAHALMDEILLRDDVKVLWLQLGIVNNEACEKAISNGLKAVQNRCPKIEYERLMK